MGISKSQGNKEENHEIRGICFFFLREMERQKKGQISGRGGGGYGNGVNTRTKWGKAASGKNPITWKTKPIINRGIQCSVRSCFDKLLMSPQRINLVKLVHYLMWVLPRQGNNSKYRALPPRQIEGTRQEGQEVQSKDQNLRSGASTS